MPLEKREERGKDGSHHLTAASPKVALFLFASYAGLPDMLSDKISQHPIHLKKRGSLENTDIYNEVEVRSSLFDALCASLSPKLFPSETKARY